MRAAFLMIVLVVAALAAMISRARHRAQDPGWMDRFAFEPGELSATGRNPFFVLEPGYVLELEDGDTRLVITVLDQTELIDGVETRVVEERESEGDRLVEVSRNFFAISTRTNDVFYFGEDVDEYRDGVVAGHEGAWRSGVNGARFGLMMPGEPLLGARFYEEIAPGIAMDRAEITSLTDSLDAPAGRFRDVLETAETTPLERGAREYKYYAPGVGLLRDGSLRLVKYGPGA
jgi:hypothetical protein